MIDYPFFQRRGYPIGFGSVESAHQGILALDQTLSTKVTLTPI
jgi:hypothetical protein